MMYKMKKTKLILILVITISVVSNAQIKSDTLFVAHWNVENLFDTVDDPKTNDEEFLPESQIEWTKERLDNKLYNLARVIRSMNNNKGPDILGMCEVEHQSLIDSMLQKFLSDKNYSVAYLESPDERGIDNGLVFNKDKLSLLNVQGLYVSLTPNDQTRLILFVKLLLNKKDTLNVFVNHWPSRRGGQEQSEWARIAAAKTLRHTVDSLFSSNKKCNIIIVGDFNDEPNNISITENLKAAPFLCDTVNKNNLPVDNKTDLFNLAYKKYSEGDGSFFYRDNFNMLDQIIISRNLLLDIDLKYECNSFEVYRPEFIVTHSGKFKGTPFPTYGGKRYLGGYSDHFPVIAKFIY